MLRRLETCSRRGRGFTLMEVTLALGVASLLMLAMGGALMVSTSALDTASDSGSQTLQAAGAATMLGAELAVAQELYSVDPADLYFTVPDRDGDGMAEEIEYTWGGAGKPLLRSYQGGAAVPVIQSVQSLAVQTATRSPAVPVEGAETVLASCETPTGSMMQSTQIDDTHFVAQYVRPTMPSAASSWKITRVKLYLSRASGNTKGMRLSVRTADASLKPTGTILASVVFTSATVTSVGGAWLEFAVGPVTGLAPGTGVCIVLDAPLAGDCNVFRVVNGTNQPYNTHYMSGDNLGAWSAPNDTQDLKFILTGSITTMVEP